MKQTISGIFILFLSLSIYGQNASYHKTEIYRYGQMIPCITLEAPDVQALLDEDNASASGVKPVRFGHIIEHRLDILKEGSWRYVPGEGHYLRLAISSPGAKALIPYYSNIQIASGSWLRSDNLNRDLTKNINFTQRSGQAADYSMEPVIGDTVLIEYFQPIESQAATEILLSGIAYAYKDIYGSQDFGHAGKCEVNIACSEGFYWQKQKKSAVRILARSGAATYWCSGSLVNNTYQDKTPYLLTAFHCGNGASVNDFNNWQFYFNFESNFCANPVIQPASDKINGALKVASSKNISQLDSDFLLLKLNQNVPDTYKPYYAGWSASGDPSPDGVVIHHPQGDIKKISTYTSPTFSTSWSSTPNSHWRVFWTKTTNGHGVTEGGSSGSPLFNFEGKIIGTLTGGDASCDTSFLNKPDYFGKFSFHWDKTGSADSLKLKPWLDPATTGLLELDGLLVSGISDKNRIGFHISPNPATDVVRIYLTDNYIKIDEIKLFDINGIELNRLKNHFSGEISLSVNHLPSGIYIIQIQSGQTISHSRFIKK